MPEKTACKVTKASRHFARCLHKSNVNFTEEQAQDSGVVSVGASCQHAQTAMQSKAWCRSTSSAHPRQDCTTAWGQAEEKHIQTSLTTLMKTIVAGFIRWDTGMEMSLPSVMDPQKRLGRYPATLCTTERGSSTA